MSYRDTVSSVGLIPRSLPFTGSNAIVRTFRHAIALDERRAKFATSFWPRMTAREKVMHAVGDTGDKLRMQEHHHHQEGTEEWKLRDEHERMYSRDSGIVTDVEEVGDFAARRAFYRLADENDVIVLV